MDGSSKKDLPGPQPTEAESEQQIQLKKQPGPATMPDAPPKITLGDVSEAYVKGYRDAVDEFAQESAQKSPATSQKPVEVSDPQETKTNHLILML